MHDLNELPWDGKAVPEYDQDECYAGLPMEVCERLEQRALRIKMIMARDVVEVGGELTGAREEFRHNKQGGFETWVKNRTGLSLATAYNCLDVHEQFGNLVNFTKLDIARSAQYLLAAKSTPPSAREEALHRAEAGEKITTKLAKEIIEAQQRAEEAEQKARVEIQHAHDHLTEVEARAHQEITRLTQRIDELQQEMATLTQSKEEIREVEKEVIPPEVTARLEQLQSQVHTLTEQRNALSKRAEQLGADLSALLDVQEARREQLLSEARIRHQWREVTDAFHRQVVQLLGQFPSPLDTQVFEAEEWERLAQTEAVAQRMLGECRTLREAPQRVFVDADA